MQLNLKNPLVFFDLETTGINIVKDRIVEISFVKVYPNGKEESKTRRINPEMPIPPESTAIHGITDEDVKDCPTFTMATYEVLKAQLDRYPELQNDINFLSQYSSYTNNVDFAGRMVYNDKGEEVINFGKYKGRLVEEVLKNDPGYYSWIMNGDFPLNTKKILTEIKLRGFNSK